MKLSSLALAAGLTLALAGRASACQVLVSHYVSAYDDGTGEFIGGHWQLGWEDVPCDYGGGGSPPAGGGGSGGGGLPTQPLYPQNLIDLKNLYSTQCGENIEYGRFLDQSDYNYAWMPFPWDQYKYSGYDYVLLDAKLADGTKSVDGCMALKEMSMPPISEPGNGGGYRPPATNGRPCDSHVHGLALDLTIKTWNGTGFGLPYDCKLWNELAACAHDAGAWVEPWSQIIAEGAPHFHFGFNSPPNNDYGDACAP
jgi:hypothetical protein